MTTTIDTRRAGTRALAVGVTMAITVNAFEAMSVATAMPAVTADLHGDALYGAAFSAYMLASLVALVAAGEQADRRGPAGPFLAGVTSFAIGLVIAGLAPTMVVVVLGRAFQGAGAGTLASVAYVAVGRAWPSERQPRLFALLASAWIIPSLIAPSAAGLISEQWSWRWVFLGLLPLLPVLVVLALPALATLPPPTTPPTASRVPRALVLAIGVGLIVVGLDTDRLWLVVTLTGLGLVLGGRALLWLLPSGTARAKRGVPAAVAARLCVGIGFFGADTFIPLAATRIHGASTFAAGIVITGAAMTWTAGAAWAARTAATTPAARTVRTGFVALSIGVAGTIPVVFSAIPLAVTFVAWCIAGFGIGLVFNTTASTTMASTPPGAEGLASSQLQIADAVGFALVGGTGGALVALADRTSLTLATTLAVEFVFALTVALIGVVVGGRVERRSVPERVADGSASW
jgi:MFS family permease